MNNKKTVSWSVVILAILASVFFIFKNNQSNNAAHQNIFGGSSQPLTTLQKEIVKHFRDGNIPALSVYFEEEVALNILGVDDLYTKEEAENTLIDFCQLHTPKQFFIKHHGANKSQTEYYLIGELTTAAAKKYRVYISNTKEKITSMEVSMLENI